MKIFQIFVKFWKVETFDKSQISEDAIGMIVPISFTTLRDRLVNGTEANDKSAIALHKSFPNAKFAFSCCSYIFPGADKVEERLRLQQFETAGIRPIVADSILNTVDEALQIKEKLDSLNIHPKGIIVITGELHSRSTAYIWKKVFPETKIWIHCTPYTLEVQPDHLVKSQRKMWTWVRDNIVRQIALHLLPLNFVRKIKHTHIE